MNYGTTNALSNGSTFNTDEAKTAAAKVIIWVKPTE